MIENGEMVTGEVEAPNRSAAIRKLAEQGRTLFHLSDADEDTTPLFLAPKLWFRRVSPASVAFTTRQLAEVLEAGMPLTQAFASMRKFSTSKPLSEVLEDVTKQLYQGQPLSAALSRHPAVFSELYISLVKVGETSGKLGEMLTRVADFLERELELNSKIRSALAYPAFVLAFCIGLCYVMVAYLLPGFEPIWTQSGLDLSHYPITEVLLKLSHMTHNIYDEAATLLLLLGLGLTVKKVLSSAEGARKASEAAFKIPLLGHFVRLAVTARVANSLASQVEAGVPITQAVRLSAKASGNILTEEALEKVAKGIEHGKPLSQCFKEADLFPPLLVQMIATGEDAGKLPDMLKRIGAYYQKQLDHGVQNLSSLIEPVTMVVVGGIVGVFIIGVILPIMGIASAIQVQ